MTEFTLRDDSVINVRRMKFASGMHYDLKAFAALLS